MTTASTNTTVSNASTATFDTWVNEVFTNLVTNCGLTQTADTGQMAVPCVTALPGAGSTSAGYYVFRFNDTLQATAPVFIKLEFGTGSSTTGPMMWITVGTGTNGAGTINGTVMTRVAVCNGQNPNSTVTNYVSRFCYNATQGFLGMVFKIGGNDGANVSIGGFMLFRSINNAGAPTADSLMLLTNSKTATGGTSAGSMLVIDYNLSVFVGTGIIPNANEWAFVPFKTTTTLEGTAGQIFPVFQYTASSTVPGYGMTNAVALACLNEIAVGATVNVTPVGTAALTFISVSGGLGTSAFTDIPYGTGAGFYTLLMIWM